MSFNIIISAGLINFILAAIVLSKAKSRLNISFAVMSALFGLWNVFVALWSEAGIGYFGRLNFIVISFIPPAGMFFVLSLYRVREGRLYGFFYAMLAAASAMSLYAAGTFFFKPLLEWYDTKSCRLLLFIYMLASLAMVLAVLFAKYPSIRFKQEKNRVKHVLAAFVIIFAGGMLDLASSSGLATLKFKYAGNLASAAYAAVIFSAIMRSRLFSADIILRQAIAYTAAAAAAGVLYYAAHRIFAGDGTLAAAAFFVISLFVFYYGAALIRRITGIIEKSGPLTGAEAARRAIAGVSAMKISEREKTDLLLAALKEKLELDCAVYSAGSGYMMRAAGSSEDSFRRVVEDAEAPERVMIRYEESQSAALNAFFVFGADILVPVLYGGAVTGVLAGRKLSGDISFTQEEVDVLRETASAAGVYLEAAEQMKRKVLDENIRKTAQMAGQMAHEIKNPLAALWGAAQLIEGKNESDRENIGIISGEIQRLSGILEGWRDFSGDIKLDCDVFDAAALLAETVKLMAMKPGAPVFRIDDGGRVNISADREKIKQVLINLLENAAYAAQKRENPVVEAGVRLSGGSAVIKVRDNGSGISGEIMSRVKEPMFTSKPKGSGLGLAVCDRIVRMHNGELLLDSDGNSWAEARVVLPAESAECGKG